MVVGEDILGSFVKTRIDVVLKDSTGNVLPNKLIEFSAKVEGVSFGEFNINSSYTNADGLASVNFLDKDQSAYDNAATPTHEGVTVEAKHVVGKENFKKKGKNHIIEDPVKAHEAIKKLESLWNNDAAQKTMTITSNKTQFIVEFKTTGAMEAKLALEQALKSVDAHCKDFMTSIDAAG